MERVSGILSEILEEIIRNPEVAEIFLRELWPQMVGPELVEKIQPRKLIDGRLEISVLDREWKAPLREMLPILRQSINTFWNYPLVEKIVLVDHLN